MISPGDPALVPRFGQALAEQRLHMAYQPKVALTDGNLVRVEALVRWDEPDLGLIPPSVFVPLAEAHGLIGELTVWVLETSLSQWVRWREQGLETSIAVNMSALSLEKLDFPDLVERTCRRLGVPTDCLVLELTEGATQPLINLMDTLTRFRIKGIRLALDDFGTGYSSLLQLRHLPFTELKIDRAFVSDLPVSNDCRLIVRCIVDLAHGLGLTTTAEGVETVDQLAILRELGCDLAQGYLISRALGPDRLQSWREQFDARWPQLTGELGALPS
ncbi:MAG: EAL domain-containing protein [Sphingomicrobium sp.]